MKVYWRIAAITILCLVPEALSGQTISNGEAIVEIETTKCYGSCPAYKLKIFEDGRVLFEGERLVKSVGRSSGRISDEKVREVKDLIVKARVFELRRSYATRRDGCRSVGTDSPWVYATFRIDSRKKSVRHYYGCFGGSEIFDLELARFKKLVDAILHAINIEQFIGTENERKNSGTET